MNRKYFKTLRSVHIASLVLSILLVMWSILSLLLKAESTIEWIILLFMEVTVSIPGSVYALRDINKAEKQVKESQTDNNPLSENDSHNV